MFGLLNEMADRRAQRNWERSAYKFMNKKGLVACKMQYLRLKRASLAELPEDISEMRG